MKTSPPYDIESIKHVDKLESIIDITNINKEDIIITGSSCLAVRNIRVNGDLDILVAKNNRDKIPSDNLPKGISLNDSSIYDHLGLSPEKLIENNNYHDVIDGYKVIRPEIILSYKYFRNRKKDVKDRHWIGEYINRSEDWDWNLLRDSTEPRQQPSYPNIIQKGLIHLINYGVSSTIKSTMEHLDLKIPFISENSNKTRYLHSGEIMLHQYDERGNFHSYDLLSHSISNNTSERNDGVGHPKENKVVFVDEDMLVLNPETFISFIKGGVTQIPVVVTDRNKKIKDAAEFTELNIPTPQEKIINEECRVLQDSGFLPQIICWGSSRDLHDDIVNEFDQKYDHVFWEDYLIDDLNKFIELQYQVHFDNRNYGKSFAVERKKYLISQHEPVIRVVKPKAVNFKSSKQMFDDIESLKKKLRKRYREKQSSHTPLPRMILHSPNSFDENVRLNNIVRKFGTKISSDSSDTEGDGHEIVT